MLRAKTYPNDMEAQSHYDSHTYPLYPMLLSFTPLSVAYKPIYQADVERGEVCLDIF